MSRRYSETYPQGKPLIVRAATRRAAIVSFYRLAPDGSATLESQVERPSLGLVRSRTRALFISQRSLRRGLD
ncbi:MAG TPA: hypothetical protein VF611_07990 [Pyrinomonadaceae bacterium]